MKKNIFSIRANFCAEKFYCILILIFFFAKSASAQTPLYICDFDGNPGNFNAAGNNNSSNYFNGNAYGDFEIITNPSLMNSVFISKGDHTTGTGNMMVCDGGGTPSQKVFIANNSNSITGLVVGNTYIISYWILNVNDAPLNPQASIQIVINEGVPVVVQTNTCPANNTWTKVTYTFIAQNNWIQFWFLDTQINPVGNDFAFDDIELTAAPVALSLRYSVYNPTCPGSNAAYISVYGVGGTAPYTYSFEGGAYSANNIFPVTAPLAGQYVSVKDATGAVYTSPSNINFSVIANPLTITPPSATACEGVPTKFQASGGTAYAWTASPADVSLTTPNNASITVFPSQTTEYTVTTNSAAASPNLIFNPGFESGDVGFLSDYTDYSTAPYNTARVQDAYGIVTNSSLFESTMSACTDHTSGTGNMMVCDGATIAGSRIWCQTVPVKPNTNYIFSFWLETVSATSPAQIQTQVNGSSLGTALASPNTCMWIQYSYVWNSGANTTAQICLYDLNTTVNGNDFALDDISFSTNASCTIQDSVKLTITPSGPPVTGFSYASPVCISGASPVLPTLAAGFTTGGAFSASPAGLSINTATGVIDLTTSSPGNYTVFYAFSATTCNPAGGSDALISVSANNSIALTSAAGTDAQSVCINAAITPIVYSTTGAASAAVAGLPAGVTFSFAGNVLTISGSPTVSSITPYSYLITLTGPCGVITKAGTITVNAAITPTFAAVAPICAGAALAPLPTTSTNGITGTWSPALNNTATATYTFTPTAGQCAATATLTITVNPATTPTFNAVPSICNGAALAPLPTTSTNGITGTWSPALNNAATTTYTFTPTAGQCATNATLTITVNPNITPTFAAIPPICSGTVLSPLQTTSTNGITGVWTPAFNNAAPTTYTFTPNAGQCATTATATITINPATVPTFAAVVPICSGEALSPLPTTSTNGITGTWSPALNNISTTTYTFTPTAGQCATTTILTITINPAAIPAFNPFPPICSGAALTPLPTTSTNGITGTWSPALNNTATATYTFTPNAGQCAAQTSATINVNYPPIFSLGRDTFLCNGETLLLNPAMNTIVSYLWQDGTVGSSYLVKTAGLYYLTATNQCGAYTDSINIGSSACKLLMPSAFTPNNDGLNDVFKVKYPFAVNQFELIVYNRWGQKVFETNNISNGWDGTLNGIPQPAGTYVWLISLTDTQSLTQSINGTVVLIR